MMSLSTMLMLPSIVDVKKRGEQKSQEERSRCKGGQSAAHRPIIDEPEPRVNR